MKIIKDVEEKLRTDLGCKQLIALKLCELVEMLKTQRKGNKMDYQELKSKLVEALKEFMDMCDEDDLDFDEEVEDCIQEAEDKE